MGHTAADTRIHTRIHTQHQHISKDRLSEEISRSTGNRKKGKKDIRKERDEGKKGNQSGQKKMSFHNTAYSHPGYSAPPYSQGYHHPPGGQMYADAYNGQNNTQIYYNPGAASSAGSVQRQWYGHQPPQQHYGGGGCSPEADRFNRKRRRCTYMYYVLRQIAIIVPLVVVFLNINIYVSRRGRYLNDSTSPADAIFGAMWLSVPLVSSPT